jgi:hypothetical protein
LSPPAPDLLAVFCAKPGALRACGLLGFWRSLRSTAALRRRKWLWNPHPTLRTCPRVNCDPTMRIGGRRIQPHRARNEAGQAPALGHSQFGWARTAGQVCARTRSLQFHREQFPIRTAGNACAHARHVVGHVERTLALRRLRGAGARVGILLAFSPHINPSAIACSRTRQLLELVLDFVLRLRRRCGGRTRRFVAARQAGCCDDPKHKSFVHGPIL